MLLQITYEPKSERNATEDIAASIRETATDHQRLFEQSWLVETESDVDWWSSHLSPLAQPGRIFIARVQGRTNGLLPTEAWDWINPRAI